MTTEEFIITLFCAVDDRLGAQPKHPQAKLYPSEVVTIGLLWALKGVSFRHFYRWLARDYAALFAGLPERTRLQRLLLRHRQACAAFLAETTDWLMLDSLAIELIHPVRHGRSTQPLGYYLRDKGNRFLVGVRSAWLVTAQGKIVNWAWQPGWDRGDGAFFVLLDAVSTPTVLTDQGCRRSGGIPANVVRCKRGEHPERSLIETVFSLLTRIFRLKQLGHRVKPMLSTRFSYVAACFNTLVDLSGSLSIAEFAL